MTRIRAVVDANVVVSAAIRPSTPPGQVVRRAVEHGEFDLVLSTPILDEIRRTLSKPKVRRRVPATDDELGKYVAKVDSVGVRAEPTGVPRVVLRDPDDDVVIATAIAGNAGYVVTGDADLLSLGSHVGVRIVSPREFLEILDAAAG